MTEFVRSEYVEQSQVACWLRMQYPNILFTCSLAGLSNRIIARAAKMGYENGTPDLMIFEPRRILKYERENIYMAHGLFIEMKKVTEKTKKNGGVSESQAQYHKNLMNRGYSIVVCYGYDEAVSVITEYLGELHISNLETRKRMIKNGK